MRKPSATTHASADPRGQVGNLPHASGRTFATLDAYLAWLRDYAGPTGRPWFREVRANVYRQEIGNFKPLDASGKAPPLVTREELERRFGFRK